MLLLGFAVNADPKGLPTATLSSDRTAMTRSLTGAIANTGHLSIVREVTCECQMDELLPRSEVQFVIIMPGAFTRKPIR
jgi:ABC-2 type transport system permease protein